MNRSQKRSLMKSVKKRNIVKPSIMNLLFQMRNRGIEPSVIKDGDKVMLNMKFSSTQCSRKMITNPIKNAPKECIIKRWGRKKNIEYDAVVGNPPLSAHGRQRTGKCHAYLQLFCRISEKK